MQHVFVYGTLLFPEILKGLTGRTFLTRNAELKNYKRMQVSGADYPAIVKAEGEGVKGKLLLNVDARSAELLRFYEGDDYCCQKLEVTIGLKPLKASVFVWKDSTSLLSDTDWNIDHFRQNFLNDYLKYVVPDTVLEFTKLFS